MTTATQFAKARAHGRPDRLRPAVRRIRGTDCVSGADRRDAVRPGGDSGQG